jgi:hypothetical protein
MQLEVMLPDEETNISIRGILLKINEEETYPVCSPSRYCSASKGKFALGQSPGLANDAEACNAEFRGHHI